jgi:endoglucanase
MEEELLRSQRELSELVGCPGREKPVREYLRRRLEQHSDAVSVDGSGNLVAEFPASAGAGGKGPAETGDEGNGPAETGAGPASAGVGGGKRILLTAHMDEVGFMVSHVESNGFLRVASLGSIDTLLLSGTPVQFLAQDGRTIPGVFTSIPPHVRKKDESASAPASAPALEDLAVDLGIGSRERVEELGLTVGSVGTFLSPFRELGDGAVMGKAFDDRSGCNIALQTALRWVGALDASPAETGKNRRKNSLVCLFTTAEEHNHHGARAASLSQDADVVIALENTTTTDTPGVPEHQVITRLGDGPALTLADRSHIVPEELLSFIRGTAERYHIPWQYKKPVYGSTDAGNLAVLGGGRPAALISVPCRYLHAPAGVSLVSDLVSTAELVYRVCADY